MSKMIQGKALLVTVTAILEIQRQVLRDAFESPPLSAGTGSGRQGNYRKVIHLHPHDPETTTFRKKPGV
jgi:hypothetical protein